MVCQTWFLWTLMRQLWEVLSNLAFGDHSIGSWKLATVGVIYTTKTGKWYKSELSVCFSRELTSIPLVMNNECLLV